MTNAYFITVVNVVVFFYQWQTKSINYEKFTVVNHCESEQFNITVIRFKGFPMYIQQKYTKIYVNNIIIYLKIFKNHIVYFIAVFTAFQEQKITFKFTKYFIIYLKTSLLNNKINNFETFINKNCIEIISVLEFFKIF